MSGLSFSDVLTAAVIGAAAVWLAPAGAPLWATFFKAFATTLVLTAASKALAKQPPGINLLDRTQTTRTPIGSRQIIYGRVRVGGQLTFAGVLTLTNIASAPGSPITITKKYRTMNLVITFTGHEVEEIGAIWFDGNAGVDNGHGTGTGKYVNQLSIDRRLGSDDDAVFSNLLALGAAGVSSRWRQRGCAKIHVMLFKNPEVYPSGVPNISAVIKGRKVYDPRTGLAAWSDNAALCLADYLCMPKTRGGMGFDYATEIDEAALIEAAGICDEPVPLAAGGTEKRYTCNGAFLTSNEPKSVIESMLAGMAGSCICVGGRWQIHAGAWRAPTVTLTESHARGAVRTQMRFSRAEVFNGVKGTFVNAANKWQPADFPPAVNALYLSEDNGERLWKDIQFQFVTSAATAQRLAKIELERARQQITEVFPANLHGLQVQAGDTVYRSSVAKGWVNKPFEVSLSRPVIYADANGDPALGVDLTLRETAAGVWDWNDGEETTVDLAPDSDLPNPFSPTAPGIASVTEELYETTGSAGVKARVVVTLGIEDDDSLPDYAVEYGVAGSDAWTAQPTTRNLVTRIDDLAPGIYDFRARSFGFQGTASSYSATTTQEILGLTAPPADVTGFSVRAMAGMAWVTLTRHPDLDVIQGGRIILRWSPAAAADWNDGSLLSQEGWPGDSEQIAAPLMTGTYLAKARDSTGHMSENAASFEVTDANLVGYTTLDSLTEDPTFPGAKTSLAVVAGGLELSGSTAVDDIADIDAVADWDAEGGTALAGTYLFGNEIDVGSVKTVRLFPHQRGQNFDAGDLWDDRPLTIDEWADIDGATVDDVESTLYVRITTDNPAGTPSWGPWHPLPGPADYTLWGAQFKLEYASRDQTHNRNVDELRITARQAL